MMKIGEVAEAAGVNIQTLRYYERRGLLEAPARTAAGHRVYASEAVRRIRFVKRAQSLGFNLTEIESLLALRSQGMSREATRRLAHRRIREIDEKLERLRRIRKSLARLVASCELALPGPCPILESMDGASPLAEVSYDSAAGRRRR